MTPTIEEIAGWLREAGRKEEVRQLRAGESIRDAREEGGAWYSRAAQVESTGWRPIEEAPRDGTLIDLWDGVDGARIPDCKWVSGRFVYFDDQWEEWLECCDATHFMLPPAPPVKE